MLNGGTHDIYFFLIEYNCGG